MKTALPMLGLCSAAFAYVAVFDGNPAAAVFGAVYYAAFWDVIRFELRKEKQASGLSS